MPVQQFSSGGRVVAARAAGSRERPSQPETAGGRGSWELIAETEIKSYMNILLMSYNQVAFNITHTKIVFDNRPRSVYICN